MSLAHDFAADPNALLTSAEAAAYLRVSTSALTLWRNHGGGPKFHRVRQQIVRYRRADLDSWLESGGAV